jgi:hypothetical protein
MKRAALKAPCASSTVTPASVAFSYPAPNSTTSRPSWLVVPCASSSFASRCASARHPPISIVARPTPRTSGRQKGHDGEGRRQPRDQVNARLHHRGRVQVGADRRRSRHRARQPEVERRLGRLRESAEQDEQQRDLRVRAGRRRRQDRREDVRPGGLPEQDEPAQHREAARRRDEQRAQGRRARRRDVSSKPMSRYDVMEVSSQNR